MSHDGRLRAGAGGPSGGRVLRSGDESTSPTLSERPSSASLCSPRPPRPGRVSMRLVSTLGTP